MKLVIKKLNGKYDVIECLEFHEVEEVQPVAPVAPVAPVTPVAPVVPVQPENKPIKAFSRRRYNACQYNGQKFLSVEEASFKTGEHRYWINKYCQRGINGWSWQ